MTFALFLENGFVDALGSASQYWELTPKLSGLKNAGRFSEVSK